MRILLGRVTSRTGTLAVVEHLLIILAVCFAAALRLGDDWMGNGLVASGLLWRASLIAAVLQIALHYCDLYELRTLTDRRALVVGLIQALGATSAILALIYYWVPDLIIGRGVFALASVFVGALVAGWRLAFEWLSLRVAVERLLIVGTSAAAVALARELFERRQELGVELVGFVDADPARVGTAMINPGVIGAVEDIPTIIRERKVDRVVVSLADARGKLPMDGLLHMKLNDGVQFDHLASVYEEYTGKIAVENLRPSWLIFSKGFKTTRLTAASKRFLDVAVASLGLMLAAPLFLIVAAAIRLTSPGPVFYSQKRVGKDGSVFVIHKFRSMRPDAEAQTGAVWAAGGDDPRVTTVGRFLRRSRIDELPQLWNVLKGDMSFVGPRPERPEFVSSLTKKIPFYGQRHVVRPGLTGWAQVRHSYGATVDDALHKLQYELFYIKHMSIAFDLFIALETLKTVLVRRGS